MSKFVALITVGCLLILLNHLSGCAEPNGFSPETTKKFDILKAQSYYLREISNTLKEISEEMKHD